MYNIPINHFIKITNEDIDDIMCTALEGGITYWCDKADVVGEYLGEYASEQISRGGSLKLFPIGEEQTYTLNVNKLLKGIKQAIEENMYADYEWYNAKEIDTCNVDAEVADTIVQFALFGEVIYG